MCDRFRRFWCVALAVVALATATPASAAIKIRRPVSDRLPGEGRQPRAQSPDRGNGRFVGSVVFARGDQVVAEIGGRVRDRERLIVFDAGMRRRGAVVVVKALGDGVFLLRPVGGAAPGPGDRLARESEKEAIARVLRANREEDYREFLDRFPKSAYRPRVGRELFRLRMRERYPTFPGTTIEGRLVLVEAVGREVPLDQVLLKLDRFVIARTGGGGRFRIEGIPSLVEPVKVSLAVRDPRFQVAEAVSVSLPADRSTEVSVDLPVRITPTVLAGRVVDARGGAVPGAEVWTHPYTMEVLSGEDGSFRISRRKRLAGAEGGGAVDEPLFGGTYEVYAYRQGYGVHRVVVDADSFKENPVEPLRLERYDPAEEPVPELGVELGRYLQLSPAGVAPQGGGPRLNR